MQNTINNKIFVKKDKEIYDTFYAEIYNGITEKGCALLFDIISIDAPLLNLKLDHNLFGTKVKYLL